MDHFTRLALPRRFAIDGEAVERSYLAKSRESHPDFHQLQSFAEQQRSLEETAALNQAYVTLRDPFRRAEYLLTLLGGPSAREEKNLDQMFLMEMLELREQIEETRSAQTDPAPIEAELSARLEGRAKIIAERFAEYESVSCANPAAVLVSIRRELNAVKTLQSLLRDVRET